MNVYFNICISEVGGAQTKAQLNAQNRKFCPA